MPTDAESSKRLPAARQMTQLTEDLLLLARSEKLERENRKPVFRDAPGQLS